MINSRIPNEFIGPFSGPGGKEIQNLQRETGTTIVINEDLIRKKELLKSLVPMGWIDQVSLKLMRLPLSPKKMRFIRLRRLKF